jgi:hypothetical protein
MIIINKPFLPTSIYPSHNACPLIQLLPYINLLPTTQLMYHGHEGMRKYSAKGVKHINNCKAIIDSTLH